MINPTLNMVALCAMGLESVVAQELKFLRMPSVRAEDRRVFFEGNARDLARANINLRAADRVLLVLGRFPAKSFDMLFEAVKKLPLEHFIGKNDAFPIKGRSISSALHSIPDCQKIIKKAVVTRLESVYRQSWFAETGTVKQLQFLILKDEVTLMLDTSGDGLHKRGYRPVTHEAPIRETLAAGILSLAQMWKQPVLTDPMCGSGTFLIEAALMARKIAPGQRRSFAAERFDGSLDDSGELRGLFTSEREIARGFEKQDSAFAAYGFDNDPASVTLTRQNAERAGVGDCITVSQAELKDFHMPASGFLVTNPPYGERLLDISQAQSLYSLMGQVFPPNNTAIITPEKEFETLYGRKASKRRKLYNGKIECQLYLYF